MKFDKSIIVLCTPRSGSVFLSEILYWYTNRKYGYKKNLHVYFVNTYFLEKTENSVVMVSPSRVGDYSDKLTTIPGPNDHDINDVFYIDYYLDENNVIQRIKKYGFQQDKKEESIRRIKIFDVSENSGNNNVLHARINVLVDDVMTYIRDNFRGNIIITTRKNMWEQFLSRCIGEMSNVYYIKNNISICHYLNKAPYYISRDSMIKFLEIQNEYKNIRYDMKDWYGNSHVYYEDFVDNPLDSIPELLPQFSDLKEYVTPEDLKGMSKKMDYPCPKEDLFINIDEMRDAFNSIIGTD